VNQQYRWCQTSVALAFPVRGIENISRGFWQCKMSVRQRLVLLSGLLYYAQSLLALVVSVLPSLIMLWCYPYEVGPGNYLPIAPAMLGMLMLPLMIPGWRPEMLRLSMVYSVSHLMAFIDAAFGRIAPWVPSGSAKSHRSKTPQEAGIVLRTWVIVTQGLSWWAIARDLPVYKLPAYWPAIALTAIQTIILAPLLLPGYGTVPLSQILRRTCAYLAGQLLRRSRVAARPE
jgi:hypothetical protein